MRFGVEFSVKILWDNDNEGGTSFVFEISPVENKKLDVAPKVYNAGDSASNNNLGDYLHWRKAIEN